jgi:hypothetical protein
MDTIHDIRISGLSEAYNKAIFDTNIRLNRGAQLRAQVEKICNTLKIPDQSIMRAFVTTRSRASDEGRFVACPIPSRMDLPVAK